MEPDAPLISRRMEDYLDQILSPLAYRLSPFHRDELRRELRAHLWARVDAYRELGQTEGEAVTEALRQFGGAEDFTRQWQREWAQAPRSLSVRELYQAGRAALRPSFAGMIVAVLPLVLLNWSYYLVLPYRSQGWLWLEHYGMALSWTIAVFSFLILPILIGVRQGRHALVHPGFGMLAALTAEVLVTSMLYRCFNTPFNWNSPAGNEADSIFRNGIEMLFMINTIWIPVASGAATISSWWTRRRQQQAVA